MPCNMIFLSFFDFSTSTNVCYGSLAGYLTFIYFIKGVKDSVVVVVFLISPEGPN